MSDKTLHVLLVEDDPEDAYLLETWLTQNTSLVHFEVAHVCWLIDALERLETGDIDVVLLDLGLPDSRGLDTFRQAQAVAPEVPMIVLTGYDDETLALNAVKEGAQDYLFKGNLEISVLARAIYYAVERKRSQVALSRYIERLALLRELDQELTRRLDVKYVATMALDSAMRVCGAHAGLIGLIEEDHVSLMGHLGYDPQVLSGPALLKSGIVARCLRQQSAQLVRDTRADPDYAALNPDTRAQIAIPLLSPERLTGFLNVETRYPENFTQEVFEFLTLLAARIAAAIDNAQLYETAQKQVDELQELYAQVSELEELKTDMIQIAAHNLRSPLTNAVGFLWLLRKALWDEIPDEPRNFIERIEESVERMRDITDDILSLQRLETGPGIKQQTVYLQGLVEKAFKEYQEQAQRKAQCLSLNATLSPILVQGDSAMLYEAMTNLVGNAIKYTPDGGHVQLRLKSNGLRAVFEVADNGYGVPPEQQARLFQPFFRAKSEETAKVDGTGLGLNLVKKVVERHNGEIIFESHYGQGSVFGFQLPLN